MTVRTIRIAVMAPMLRLKKYATDTPIQINSPDIMTGEACGSIVSMRFPMEWIHRHMREAADIFFMAGKIGCGIERGPSEPVYITWFFDEVLGKSLGLRDPEFEFIADTNELVALGRSTRRWA